MGKQTRGLVQPREVFDPEVPELPSLLPEWRFPDTVFRQKDVLAALRPLGLRGELGWPGLVEAAASVQAARVGDARRGDGGGAGEGGAGEGAAAGAGAGAPGGGKDKKIKARDRGRALLTYLDRHEARLFELKKETSGGLFQSLQRVTKHFYTDSAAEERARERLAALHKLMSLSWVS